MKKLFLITFLIITQLAAFTQENEMQFKNFLKWQAVDVFLGNFKVEYERFVTPDWSFGFAPAVHLVGLERIDDFEIDAYLRYNLIPNEGYNETSGVFTEIYSRYLQRELTSTYQSEYASLDFLENTFEAKHLGAGIAAGLKQYGFTKNKDVGIELRLGFLVLKANNQPPESIEIDNVNYFPFNTIANGKEEWKNLFTQVIFHLAIGYEF